MRHPTRATRTLPFLAAISAMAAAALVRPASAAPPPPDFDQDVRPVLERHCFQCHGPDKQKGGLRLDQKPSVLKGGESGEPAVVPGDGAHSHLLKVVASADPDERMPPKGERLTADEVALLRRWVETGAHWTPAAVAAGPETAATPLPEFRVTDADRTFWSFVPPRQTEPPAAKDAAHADWPRTRTDRFVLAALEARGLGPSADAPPAGLIRRVTYDLTGLPPTPDEVDEFLADDSARAYEKVVDRLLASPAFGERMASLWLPLARYAEDQAHQVGSDTKFFYPNAWRYRKWVIDAFNRDLPYDRFVQYQLAADKFPEATPDDRAALGFLGLGPKYYNRGRLEVMADEWEDRVDTVTRTTLGLTVACARCHDHKFDPISQRDYYALAGVFAGTKLVNRLPDGSTQKGELDAAKVDPGTVHAVEDGDAKDLNVFIRGNVDRKGPVVPRRFLAILSPGEPVPFKDGSGRKELALAVASRDNPLAARVMVNRVWGMLLGKPIVPTPSNFGHSGQPPTNPALLDDLAVRFMGPSAGSASSPQAGSASSPQAGSGQPAVSVAEPALGWSVKRLVREVVLSSTYRQSSASNPQAAAADPANDLLWRMNRRRLTVEQWRDGVLSACGTLEAGDPGRPSAELDDPSNRRRTVYARVSRLKLNDVLMQFDYPDANVHAERRSVTNTPMQKLFVLNGPFAIAQAKALAARVAADTCACAGDEGRVARAYRLVYGREPDAEESELAMKFIDRPDDGSGLLRWEQYAQALLASNEAMYLD